MSEKTPTGLELLRVPFAAHHISKLPKPYKKDSPKGKCGECGGYHGLPAVHLDYVGHAALTDRLLDVDPLWSWEPVADPASSGLPSTPGGMWIRLTVCGVTRYGFGHPDGKVGGDAVKETIGDALRNAAMRFGAALDLWHKGQLHEAETPETPGEPDGYADWLVDFEAVADNGLEAMTKAWHATTEANRAHYLGTKDEKSRAALRAKATAADRQVGIDRKVMNAS